VERERRRTPRYVFFASAELFEEKSEVRIASRVSELSLYGCYLDMMNPFPKDTMVLLKDLGRRNGFFRRKAESSTRKPTWAPALFFLGVQPEFLPVLQTLASKSPPKKQ